MHAALSLRVLLLPLVRTAASSSPHVHGTPASASAEKGEALLNCFTNGVCDFLNRVRDWDGQSWDG